jgi:hypothetical protein
MSIKTDYIIGTTTAESWKIATAGLVGPMGSEGATGPVGGFGVVAEGYYFRSLDNAPATGVVYHDNTNDYVGVKTISPTADLDISGHLRVRATEASNSLTSGHLVIDSRSGFVHSVVPKLEYQVLDGDGIIQSFTLTSPSRGPEWLLLWDIVNNKFIPPTDYSVNNAILTFDSSKIPPGDIEVRHIILW